SNTAAFRAKYGGDFPRRRPRGPISGATSRKRTSPTERAESIRKMPICSRLGTARRRECDPPTLAAFAAALPPRGRYSRLGTARRRECDPPTLAAFAAALPPRGRYSRLGTARR